MLDILINFFDYITGYESLYYIIHLLKVPLLKQCSQHNFLIMKAQTNRDIKIPS